MANAEQVEVLLQSNPIFRLNVIARQKFRHLINKGRFVFTVNREGDDASGLESWRHGRDGTSDCRLRQINNLGDGSHHCRWAPLDALSRYAQGATRARLPETARAGIEDQSRAERILWQRSFVAPDRSQ
jgi:hypothetical protein